MTVANRYRLDNRGGGYMVQLLPDVDYEVLARPDFVLSSDYDELDGRFNAVFKQKEFAEHNWGIANQRIAKLEEALREISKDNFLYNSTQIAIKALRDSSTENSSEQK
jgi:hypothetical protein